MSKPTRDPSDHPTQPPGLDELRHDVRRLDLAVRNACSALLTAIQSHPDTLAAYQAWERARERHGAAQARLDVFEEAIRAKRGKP